ncbi:YusW family protein [Psychrobacillus sp. FJAT-51614]|uniref:YusW family protein n=1 Tax=Psychrobacillus mangrovi TaxID=3117745 RepID=A0ABU8F100_9BACI
MNKYSLKTTLITATLLLGACGTNNNEDTAEETPDGTVTNPQQSETVDESQSNENSPNELGFQYFNLNIGTLENENTIHAEVNLNDSGSEAIYKNVPASTDLQGDAAYALLEPIFAEMGLTKEMREEEVIERATNEFEINEFTNFELEIEFEDGDNKTYSKSVE